MVPEAMDRCEGEVRGSLGEELSIVSATMTTEQPRRAIKCQFKCLLLFCGRTTAGLALVASQVVATAQPFLATVIVCRWEQSSLECLIDQAAQRGRRWSFSFLHAQPSHDTLYTTNSSAARGTSTQGLSPSVERRVEACQKSVLAARHWSSGVSWAVGRRCTVIRCHSEYLGITSSRPSWDAKRC